MGCDGLCAAREPIPQSRPEHRDLERVLEIGDDAHARAALGTVLRRLRGTWHKRVNPIRLDHPAAERYEAHDALDARLFRPAVLRADEAVSRFSGELQDLAN